MADAFIIGEDFIGNDSVCFVLGDNVFYGPDMTRILKESIDKKSGAIIFGYPVKDASDFGLLNLTAKEKLSPLRKSQNNQNLIMRSQAYIFMITMLFKLLNQ